MENKRIVKDALKSNELAFTLENISFDDKRNINDYTDAELVHEAKYVLSTFYEGGHINNIELTEGYTVNMMWAQTEVAILKHFIKKYDK